jgi:N-acyl-D-aspartate/D-glutamate deacylase
MNQPGRLFAMIPCHFLHLNVKQLLSKSATFMIFSVKALACFLALLFGINSSFAISYDLVLEGGRVIDPETKLDAIRNVGISNGIVQIVTTDSLTGEEVLNVSGLIVAPGFIDLHSHAAMTIAGQKYQARDGVTTALELEAGLFPVDQSLALLKDRAFINYGVSVGYLSVRGAVKGSFSKGFSESVNDKEMDNVLKLLEDGLHNGGIGIGYPLDYISSVVSESELLRGFELAAKKEVPIFIHMRRGATPGDVTGLEEVVQLGLQTSASIHICHINSNALSGIEDFLTIVRKARSDGLDVTVEAYPYTAGSTFIGAEVFDRDWQNIYGISYSDIEWPLTGERFTKETWKEYRAKYRNDRSKNIVNHNNSEAFLQKSLIDPIVMIASDAMQMEEMNSRVHPRSTGTYARFLGRYVREKKLIGWMEAIRKVSLLPAQRLQSIVPSMRNKGRIQIGSHADITIIDPDTVIDKATFRNPNQFSEGIPHVLVGGRFVVKDNALVEGSIHGQAVLSEVR